MIYRYKSNFLIFIITSLVTFTLSAQINNLGQPFTVNYSKSEYNGGTQSWDIEYSAKAFIFIANNEGLLVYDGIAWNICKTNNKTIVRSLALSQNEDKIYVGAQGEFGFFEMENQNFVYRDLTHLIPEKYSDISDVWEMEEINDTIYFRADNKIFRFYDEEISVVDIPGIITFIKSINGRLIFNNKEKGIFALNDLNQQYIGGNTNLLYREIIDAVQLENQDHLILTRGSGIYHFDGMDYIPWPNNSETFIKNNLITSGHYFKNSKLICIGTHLGGLAIFDLKGNLQYILNSENGLQNNNITCIENDGNSNIWLGTYNGIDEVLLTSNNNRFYPDNDLKGAVYDIEQWNDQFYFATSNGLYTIPAQAYYNPLHNTKFELVDGTQGECWGLDLIDNQLFVAHNNGAYILNSKNTIMSLGLDPGVWKYLKIDDKRIFVGGYEGVGIIHKENNNWTAYQKIENFNESSRIMILDDVGILWITHPYKGIFKISSNNDFQTFNIDTITNSDGIKDLNNCYGHQLNGNFLVSNESDVYAYNYQMNKFEEDPNLDLLFDGNRLIRLLYQNDAYYYISNKTAGKIIENKIGSKTSISKVPLIPNDETFVGGFEHLMASAENQLLICTDKGVLIHNISEHASDLNILIKKVLIGHESEVAYNSFNQKTNNIVLPHNQNSIDIQYSSVFSKGIRGKLNYSYRLIGANSNWSAWNEETHTKFEFLPPGDYTFEVRSMSSEQQISPIDKIKFSIKPHFLLSKGAKTIYAILTLLTLILVSFLPRRKLLKEKIKVDKKVKDLEAANYEIQMKAKNKELAYSTMHLLQKSEFITALKDDIGEVKNFLKDPVAKKELKKVISKLQDDQRLEEDWERFSTHFDKVHHNFFKRLKEEYPNLSSKDLKMCAYLRLNLSTKEIAPLLGISIRGVEISRYRLRKKINLDKDTNLNEFMISY